MVPYMARMVHTPCFWEQYAYTPGSLVLFCFFYRSSMLEVFDLVWIDKYSFFLIAGLKAVNNRASYIRRFFEGLECDGDEQVPLHSGGRVLVAQGSAHVDRTCHCCSQSNANAFPTAALALWDDSRMTGDEATLLPQQVLLCAKIRLKATYSTE
jgi:hypothetical protein